MVSISSVYEIIIQLRVNMEMGDSVSIALKKINLKQDSYFNELCLYTDSYLQGMNYKPSKNLKKTSYRQSFLHLLKLGLNGEPILNSLKILEQEVREVCAQDLEKSLSLLPLKVLLPLLFFQFPAYMIILFSPLMDVLNDL